jgi:hypothetical protein
MHLLLVVVLGVLLSHLVLPPLIALLLGMLWLLSRLVPLIREVHAVLQGLLH